MAFSKDPKAQEARAILMLTNALTATHHRMSGSAQYDVDRDRVVVKVGGKEIAALGPREWFMSDDELQQMMNAAVLNSFGQGTPPFREPQM